MKPTRPCQQCRTMTRREPDQPLCEVCRSNPDTYSNQENSSPTFFWPTGQDWIDTFDIIKSQGIAGYGIGVILALYIPRPIILAIILLLTMFLIATIVGLMNES